LQTGSLAHEIVQEMLGLVADPEIVLASLAKYKLIFKATNEATLVELKSRMVKRC
jgi:hypothetical protein